MSDGDDPRLIGATARENRPGDAGELVGECDRQHVAVQPPRACSIQGHKLRIAAFGRRASTTCAACTNSVRKYLLPRLEILPRIVRSPVDSCFGTSPSQAGASHTD